jgi:peroxiredoxin Q/BCP
VRVLQVGMKAPTFTLDSTQGPVSLAQYQGAKNVLLIFYPQDSTPG